MGRVLRIENVRCTTSHSSADCVSFVKASAIVEGCACVSHGDCAGQIELIVLVSFGNKS